MSGTKPTLVATQATEGENLLRELLDKRLTTFADEIEKRITARPNPMLLTTFEEVENFALHAATTKMIPKDFQGKPDDIIIAVMMGKELGLPPIQSVQSIAVINGRPSVWGDAVPGLCWASGKVEDIQEYFEGEEGTDAFTAVCVAKRRGASPKTARFSQADAKKAAIFGKNVHAQYPRRMMQWRARHFALHDAFPDVLKGIGTAELEVEDAAPPAWTMPQPEKSWFVTKRLKTGDGWDNTWFIGFTSKLAGEVNAWKWMDLLTVGLAEAPSLRDVQEIGDLPGVVKTLEAAPQAAKDAIAEAFTAARGRFATAAPPAKPREARTAAPASPPATGPAETAPPATDQPAATAPAFEGYLSDETGEIVAGPFADELAWAGAFHKLFTETADDADKDAVWDSNIDIIETLRTHATIGPMLASLSAEEQEAQGDHVSRDVQQVFHALELTENRGKPDWKTYLTAAGGFYETLVLQSAEAIEGWLATQMPTLMRAGNPQQLAVRGRIVKQCQELGVAVPECVAPLGVVQQPATEPTKTETPLMDEALVQTDGTEWPMAWAKDVGHVEARLSEMRTLSNKHDMQRYFGSTPQTLLLDRLEREDKGRLATHFRVQAKAIMDAA